MMESSKKDLKFYRKAMSFLKEKWDLKTRSPKESGNTPEDVLEYVCVSMYAIEMKSKQSVTILNDDDDDGDQVFTRDRY